MTISNRYWIMCYERYWLDDSRPVERNNHLIKDGLKPQCLLQKWTDDRIARQSGYAHRLRDMIPVLAQQCGLEEVNSRFAHAGIAQSYWVTVKHHFLVCKANWGVAHIYYDTSALNYKDVEILRHIAVSFGFLVQRNEWLSLETFAKRIADYAGTGNEQVQAGISVLEKQSRYVLDY